MPTLFSLVLYVFATLVVFARAGVVPPGALAARQAFQVDVFTLPSGGITLTVTTPVNTQGIGNNSPATANPPTPQQTSSDTDPDDGSTPPTSLLSSISPTSTDGGANSTDAGLDSADASPSKVSVSVVAIIVILSIIAIITAFIGLIFYVRTRRNVGRKGRSGAQAVGGVYAPRSAYNPQMEETIRTPLNQSFGSSVYGAAIAGSAAPMGYSSNTTASSGRVPIQYGIDEIDPIQTGPYAVPTNRDLGKGASVYYPPKPTKPVRPQNPFADVTPSTQALDANLDRSQTAATSRSGRRLDTPTPPPLGELPMPPPPMTPTGSGSRPSSPGGSLWVQRKVGPSGLVSPKLSPSPSFKV